MSTQTIGQADYAEFCSNDNELQAKQGLWRGRCGYDYFQPGRYCQPSPGIPDCLDVCDGNTTCALFFMATIYGVRQCCQHAEPITVTTGAVAQRNGVDWMLMWNNDRVDTTSGVSFSIAAAALSSSTSSSTAESTSSTTSVSGTQSSALPSFTSSSTAIPPSTATNETVESATLTSPAANDPAIPSSTLTISSTPSLGLSTGAKAGIEVGAISAVALIASVLFIAYKRRKSTRSHTGEAAHEVSPELETKSGHFISSPQRQPAAQ